MAVNYARGIRNASEYATDWVKYSQKHAKNIGYGIGYYEFFVAKVTPLAKATSSAFLNYDSAANALVFVGSVITFSIPNKSGAYDLVDPKKSWQWRAAKIAGFASVTLKTVSAGVKFGFIDKAHFAKYAVGGLPILRLSSSIFSITSAAFSLWEITVVHPPNFDEKLAETPEQLQERRNAHWWRVVNTINTIALLSFAMIFTVAAIPQAPLFFASTVVRVAPDMIWTVNWIFAQFEESHLD